MPSSYVWTGTTSTAFATGTNWSPSGPPTTGDSAYFDFNATRALAASDQHTVVLANLFIKSTCTYDIGDAATSLQIAATNWRLGDSSNSASAGAFNGRINLDFGTNQFTGVVVNTGSTSTDSGKEPVRVKGTHASNRLIVTSGRVGVATDNIGDTAQLSEIDCLGGTINVGSGTTLATFRQEAGVGLLNSAVTTIQQDGGTLTTAGSGAITTANISGTANFGSTGTITTLEVFPTGRATFNGDYRSKTVTTIKMHRGSVLVYDPAVITISNPIQLIGCGISDVTITTPLGLTVAVVKT
jgi:hypothetical protein